MPAGFFLPQLAQWIAHPLRLIAWAIKSLAGFPLYIAQLSMLKINIL
jgi:hypothetical protein